MLLYAIVLGIFMAGLDEPVHVMQSKEIMTLAECQKKAPEIADGVQKALIKQQPKLKGKLEVKWSCRHNGQAT